MTTTAQHVFADAEQQREATRFGMWVFLLSEVMLFGPLLTVYATYRSLYPDSFELASRQLNTLLGTVNTLVLVASSLTMALAHHAAERQRRWRMICFLSATALLGGVFLGIKAYEYGHVRHGGEMFFLLYFILTGVHAVHMAIGVCLLTALVGWSIATRGPRPITVELTGLYWHFIDIVWIFLFPLLYLVGLHR